MWRMTFSQQFVAVLMFTSMVVEKNLASKDLKREGMALRHGIDTNASDGESRDDLDIDECRMLHGVNTKISDFPHTVIVLDQKTPICTGVILSKKWVLTSSLGSRSPQPESNLRIRAGSNDYKTSLGGSEFTVSRIIIHTSGPRLQTDHEDFNFVLLEVRTEFEFGPNIRAATLPLDETHTVPDGALAIATGFGTTEKDTVNEKIGILRRADLHIISASACRDRWASTDVLITDRMLCAMSPGGGIGLSKGDTGGALEVGGIVVGIAIQFKDGKVKKTHPDIFSNIASVRSWITSETGV